MYCSWVVLVPPLLVIALAALTKRVLFSLFMGITSASLIVHNFELMNAVHYIGARIVLTTQVASLSSWQGVLAASNLYIILFLLLLGVLISMIRHSGAAYAYGKMVMAKIKTAAGAERASLLLSKIFFIDDYFSGITVGSVMQPITDQYAVPRVKLALLVNAVAAPIAIVVPLSSWIAELIGQFRNSGVSFGQQATVINADPYALYLSAIPFMIYALVTVLTVWYMVTTRVSFGLVARHERYAEKTGELFGGKIPVVRRMTDVSAHRQKSSKIIDFIFPIVLLFVSVIGITLWTGDWWCLGGQNDLLTALQQAKLFLSFFCGALGTVIATMVYYLGRERVTFAELPLFIREGIILMGGSLVMLVLIWTLSGIIRDDLKTGQFLADILIGRVTEAFIPLMFFVLAAVISTLIATAWGTLGILIPMAMSMVPTYLGLALPIDASHVPLLSALLGAIICGSLVGMHMSPVADVMVMSAASAGSYHLDLVRAQIQLAIPTVIASCLGFVVVGLTLATYGSSMSALMGVGSALGCNIIFITIIRCIERWRSK